MVYAAASASSVIQLMEYLLQFARMILRIKKFQIKRFTEKARKLAGLFEDFSSSTDQSHRTLSLAQLVQTLHVEVTVEIEDLFAMSKLVKFGLLKAIAMKLAFDVGTPGMLDMVFEESEEVEDVLEEVPKILKEIGLVEAELQKFSVKMPEILKEIDLAGLKNFSDGMRIILKDSECSFNWVMVKLGHVFLAIIKLKRETTFVHQEAMKMKSLCQDLSFLVAFLRDSANLYKNHDALKNLEECISGMVSRAEDFIDEKLLDISLQSKLNTLIVEQFRSSQILSIIKTASNEIFHKENGVLPGLLSTFQEIESLKEKVKNMYGETMDIENLQSASLSAKVSKPPLVKENMVVGLDDISNEILERLTNQSCGLGILTIVGMGGIGKTTLARKVYDHPFAVYHFHCRAWVTLSQVYQVRNLLLGLLRAVTQLTDEICEMSKEKLAECLYKRLKGRRYLIVMDDIWSIEAWDDVKRLFPDDKNGSRVLLTSRLKSVAVYVNPKSPPYRMSLLAIDESWKLLEQKIFGKGSCPLELVDPGKHIVKKCQGLPLAIVVVAGYLSRIKRTYKCWKDTAASVSSLVIIDPEQCLEILALSYNRLPHHLKACFLYMGGFPEDWEIEVPKLINLWTAEGLLDLKSAKSLEEVGEDCLNDLVDRSLVLAGKRSSSGKIKTCRIHDLLRELCLREAQKENFMHVIKRDSHGFPADLNDKRLLGFHLEFHGDVHLLPSLPLVRSFLCFSAGCFFSADIFLLHLRFKLLRVLDIRFLRFDHFPEQILKLVLLRYLELHVSYMFPAQFSELRNLQTLVIHGQWIPKQHGRSPFLQLAAPQLRHLHIITTRYSCVPVFPDSFGFYGHPYQFAPEFLQTLFTVRFASCTGLSLRAIPHLKKLGICETKEDYDARGSSNFLFDLVLLEKLEILKCSFYAQNSLKPYKLTSGPFPSSIRQLTLSWSFLPWKDMIWIARLPNLEVLKLKNYAFQGQEWTPTEDGFHQLKHLLIEKTDLERWQASSIHFPRLQCLVLRSCSFLEEIPFSIGVIPTLELIELHNCSKSAELSAEEIRAQIDGVEVHIQSNQSMENHLKGTLSSDSCWTIRNK